MNKLIRNPITNAIGLGLFSAFYGVIFLGFSNLISSLTGQSKKSFWIFWDGVLTSGGHQYIAFVLIALSFIVIILLFRHKPYDEYHTAILINCLLTALILTLAAIAVLFLVILADPVGAIGKITFFVSLNWITVVAANLIYLLFCAKK